MGRVLTGAKRHWRTALDVTTSVILVGAAITLTARAFGSRSGEPPPPPPVPTTIQPKDDRTLLGDPKASVWIVEFSDFQCPFCGKFARETFPEIRERYLNKGTVALLFRNLPLERIHPLAMDAAVAADCAGQQGAFWTLHDALFSQGASLLTDSLKSFAIGAGINSELWTRCAVSGPSDRVKKDVELAKNLGISGTPYFIIGVNQPNGIKPVRVLRGFQSVPAFEDAITSAAKAVVR